MVLLLFPAWLVTLYAVLSWLDPPEPSSWPAHFAVLALLTLSTWLPVYYASHRQARNSALRDDEADRLARERTLLRTLIDNLPDFIYVKDRESKILFANIALARVMGLSDPELLTGMSGLDLYGLEAAARYAAGDQEVMRSGLGQINRSEFIIDPNGNRIDLLTTKVPLRDTDGAVIGDYWHRPKCRPREERRRNCSRRARPRRP